MLRCNRNVRKAPLRIQPSKGIGLGVSGEVVGDSLWVSSGENQPWPTHLEPTPDEIPDEIGAP